MAPSSRLPELPENPSGWYAVAASAELPAGAVTARTLFGQSLALARTESGRPLALFATCPHLGGHLGRGRIAGERVVCPFHRFEFDGGGRCVRTGYGTPPPKARARTLPVCERNGLVLLWWDQRGGPPTFEIPEHDAEAWCLPKLHTQVFRGHPQEVTENSVDVGHFTTVHGFHAVERIAPLAVEGAHLSAAYRFVHRLGPLSWQVRFTAHCFGLGYSFVEVEILATGTRTRLWVLPTPRADGLLELRLGAAGHAAGPAAPLMRRLIRQLSLWLLVRDARADVPIWQHRQHVERPALARGDGPIGRYRRWARQFYPEVTASADSREVA